MGKITLKFIGYLQPGASPVGGANMKVFVDGWTEWTDVKRNANSVEVNFNSDYLSTQRIITFQTSAGEPSTRYAVKTNVNQPDDIVIAVLNATENIPVLGTYKDAEIKNPVDRTPTAPTPVPSSPVSDPAINPTERYNVGTSTTTTTSGDGIGVTINYEETTVDIGVQGFNTNTDQIVDATVGEVVGDIIN